MSSIPHLIPGLMLAHLASKVNSDADYVYTSSETAAQFIDMRQGSQKVCDFALSLLREISFTIQYIPNRIWQLEFNSNYDSCENSKQWKKDSKGLYVLLHGLNGHPGMWNGHIRALKEEEAGKDLFVPFVPQLGNCTLEEAADPILTHIESYTKQFPHNRICLIGVSNGGRIASYLEVCLRKRAPKTCVMVSAIAAVLYGAKTIDKLSQYSLVRRIAAFIYTPAVTEELAWGSQRARHLIDEMRKPHMEAERAYHFFASREDLLATDFATSFPKLHKNERVIITSGYGHNGVIGAVRQQQLQECQEWMGRKN
jgi:predicted alpha/beta-fold hydrolase